MPKTKSKSEVWSHFVRTETGGTCKACGADVKSANTTTNLYFHLQRRHPTVYSTLSKVAKEPSASAKTLQTVS